ncbi:hypothetical protein U1Q18_038494 [Sarracenia purpurea var. burkii]
MAEQPPSGNRKSSASPTTVIDLNIDSLVHCATYLNLQDISSMAMSCKYLKRVAYSDSIWQRFFASDPPALLAQPRAVASTADNARALCATPPAPPSLMGPASVSRSRCLIERRVSSRPFRCPPPSVEQWPGQMSPSFLQISSVRDAYLARHTALQQFKFSDPLTANFYTEAKPYNHLFLNKNDIIFSQVLNLISFMMFLNF